MAPRKLRESTRVVRPEFHEREDRLGVDRHLGLGALDAIRARSASSFSTIPLWTLDCAMANGVVVRRDIRVTLREVAHVDHCLPGLLRDGELVEKCARAAAELRQRACRSRRRDGRIRRRPRLGDPREKCLGSECPVDGRLRIEAESGYSAHELEKSRWVRLSPTQLILSVDRTTRRP